MSQQDKGKSFRIAYRSAEQERNYNTCSLTTREECKKKHHIFLQNTILIFFDALIFIKKLLAVTNYNTRRGLFRDMVYLKDTNFIAQTFY